MEWKKLLRVRDELVLCADRIDQITKDSLDGGDTAHSLDELTSEVFQILVELVDLTSSIAAKH